MDSNLEVSFSLATSRLVFASRKILYASAIAWWREVIATIGRSNFSTVDKNLEVSFFRYFSSCLDVLRRFKCFAIARWIEVNATIVKMELFNFG